MSGSATTGMAMLIRETLENPLAAVMGLIYVNPEGPNLEPRPCSALRTSGRPSPEWPWTTRRPSH